MKNFKILLTVAVLSCFSVAASAQEEVIGFNPDFPGTREIAPTKKKVSEVVVKKSSSKVVKTSVKPRAKAALVSEVSIKK